MFSGGTKGRVDVGGLKENTPSVRYAVGSAERAVWAQKAGALPVCRRYVGWECWLQTRDGWASAPTADVPVYPCQEG